MKQEHSPEDLKTYNKGANHDLDREFLGAQQEGEYIDSRNFRPSSTESRKEALEKIKGEEIEDPPIAIGGIWKCTGSIDILNKKLSCWADTSNTVDPLIRIDGQVVLQSANAIFIDPNKPLQLDKNESCVGGEVFITDNDTPPVILNVQDMIDSVTGDPTKYFSAFNLSLYQINLSRALDIPVFIGLEDVGAGGGLPIGTYEYKIRYVSEEGDRTNQSEATPPIPVVRNLSESSLQYPYSKTYGDDPNPESNTSFGIRLRFRVTNIFNYDFIEIIRIAHNEGAGIEFTPQEVIVAKIDIDDGEISVREFLDPVESNTQDVIPDDEATRQVSFIESAKTLRYFDRRLVTMNVKLASRQTNLIFDEIAGKKVFTIKENIQKSGYNDPYYFVYKKHYMGGDKVGLGVQVFDGVGGRGFVTKIPGFESFEIPNRRDEIDANGQKYSYGGTVKAANSKLNVSQTHEIFDLEDAVVKDDICSFKNIHKKTGVPEQGFKSTARINEDCSETENGEIENQGAQVTLGKVFPYYHPYTPVSDNDSNVEGHNYHVNTKIGTGATPNLSNFDYQPRGFSPTYFSTGIAVAGVGNLPPWAKAFSVVRTDTAKRVVAQGLGMYAIDPAIYRAIGNKKLATKDLNKMWFFSPDIENGVTSSDTVNDMIDNPEDYELQFVSPLGFFSEIYNFEENSGSADRDRMVDMIVYARMLRDIAVIGQINPLEDGNMGIPDIPFDGYRYIKHGKWRNTTQQSTAFNSGDQGNNLLQVESARRIQEGRGNYMEIETTSSFYGTGSTGGTGSNDFEDQGTKNFHEPFYIVNIVQSGREVRNQNIESYRSTGHYQKLESIIGEGNGAADQDYILVDERWEDCIPALEASHPNAIEDRFIYIQNPDESEEKWVNVTFKSAGQVATILADISNNGFWGPNVKGVYRHRATTQESVNAPGLKNTDRFWHIVFNEPGFEPQDEQKIIVKYDNNIPIRVFGGDSLIGESLFAPIDREANSKDDAAETQFALGIGFPYRTFKLNPRHYVIKRTTGVDHIQDRSDGTLGYIRQMVVMFAVESRIAVHSAHNADYPLQYFPLINYVMRPNRWKDLKEEADEDEASIYSINNIWDAYGDDYGFDEWVRWKFGGFRFIQNVNSDYSVQPGKTHVSKPEFGFEEKTEFCTRAMHSLPRATNQQDSPGLRTFPANNVFDFDDDQGEIKFAYDERTGGKGENLYAVCEKGVVIALHKKSILSEITASDVGLLSTDRFIQGQYWISKTIGCPDERWRGKSEGSISIPTESGFIRKEAVFFPGATSYYRLFGNSVDDIAKGHYYSKIKTVLRDLRPGLQDDLTAVYDENHDESWLSITRPARIISLALSIGIEIDDSYNDGDLIEIRNADGTTLQLSPSAPEDVDKLIICNKSQGTAELRNGDNSLIIILQPGECVRLTKQGPGGNHTWDPELDDDFRASRVYVYGQEKNRFYGEYDYAFDQYVNIGDEVFGLRDLSAYKLNQGLEINGEDIEAWVIQASALQINSEKEFIRYKATHKPDANKPTRVEFMDIDMNVLCALDPTIQGPLYLKNYDGSEQFIPRKDQSVSPTRDRLQDRVLLYKTFHNLAEDFVLKTTSIQFKILK